MATPGEMVLVMAALPISVIIPTLNEQVCLPRTLSAVRAQSPHEIIVVDGGSTDGTREVAAEADRLLQAPRGRARQMNAGAAQARGEILLFLHADCVPEAGALSQAVECLHDPGVAAGCFQQRVDAAAWIFRCVDRCAGWRVQLTGIAYGDQGLFLCRDVFARCGGFPEVGLMEDLFLCLRLRREGRMVIAPKRLFISPRRWRQVGIIRQTLRNWCLTGLAAAGVSPDRLARFYPMVR
jgi:rSAM/selenodomain-associated transferase 2